MAAWGAPVDAADLPARAPDRYPAYLDRRVYQGSSGRVFPLPFHDRISETRDRPRLAGPAPGERRTCGCWSCPSSAAGSSYAVDKRTGYPLFYANPVIKPALVGLAGPWLAGGVEFNWPQHHRPATFLPTAWTIEEADDGGHGLVLRPRPVRPDEGHARRPAAPRLDRDRAAASACSTAATSPQTFLWWANVAAAGARRLPVVLPRRRGAGRRPRQARAQHLPGRDRRPTTASTTRPAGTWTAAPTALAGCPGDRLDWPRNIPVPTSYMCLDSAGDFFGGYDHRARAGFVHWADHHYAVGKKQWTWGDDAFGHAWNRNLADDDAAYIELMAGVYTDNQPDFSHLAPGETKTFSQYWYPIAGTGPAVAATLDVALGRPGRRRGRPCSASTPPTNCPAARLSCTAATRRDCCATSGRDLTPAAPRQIVGWTPPTATGSGSAERRPDAADLVDPTARIAATADADPLPPRPPSSRAAPRGARRCRGALPDRPAPGAVPARHPLARAVLARGAAPRPRPRRDPHRPRRPRYRAARYAEAERHLRAAIARLTRLNPNPAEGEAHYLLGLTLRPAGSRRRGVRRRSRRRPGCDAWLRPGQPPAGDHRRPARPRRGGADQGPRRPCGPARTTCRSATSRSSCSAGSAGPPRPRPCSPRRSRWIRSTSGRCSSPAGSSRPPGSPEAQTLLDVGLENARVGELRGRRRAVRAGPRRRPRPTAGPDRLRRAGRLPRRGGAGSAGRRPLRPPPPAARARAGDRTWNFASRLDDVAGPRAGAGRRPERPDGRGAARALAATRTAGADDAIELWPRRPIADPGDPVVWRNLGVAAFNHRATIRGGDRGVRTGARPGADRRPALVESDQLLEADRRSGRAPAGSAGDARRASIAGPRRPRRRVRPPAARPPAAPTTRCGFCGPGASSRGRAARVRCCGPGSAPSSPWPTGPCAPATRRGACEHAGRPSTRRTASVRPGTRWPTRPRCCWRSATRPHGRRTARRRPSGFWRAAAEARGDFADMAPQAYSENTYFSVLAARRLGDDDAGRRARRRADRATPRSWPGRRRRSTTSPPRCRPCCCSTTTRSAAAT